MPAQDADMKKTTAAFNTFLAGIGSAFALFPTGQIETVRSQSIEARMYGNFARAGQRIESAMRKARDEQAEEAEKAG